MERASNKENTLEFETRNYKGQIMFAFFVLYFALVCANFFIYTPSIRIECGPQNPSGYPSEYYEGYQNHQMEEDDRMCYLKETYLFESYVVAEHEPIKLVKCNVDARTSKKKTTYVPVLKIYRINDGSRSIETKDLQVPTLSSAKALCQTINDYIAKKDQHFEYRTTYEFMNYIFLILFFILLSVILMLLLFIHKKVLFISLEPNNIGIVPSNTPTVSLSDQSSLSQKPSSLSTLSSSTSSTSSSTSTTSSTSTSTSLPQYFVIRKEYQFYFSFAKALFKDWLLKDEERRYDRQRYCFKHLQSFIQVTKKKKTVNEIVFKMMIRSIPQRYNGYDQEFEFASLREQGEIQSVSNKQEIQSVTNKEENEPSNGTFEEVDEMLRSKTQAEAQQLESKLNRLIQSHL